MANTLVSQTREQVLNSEGVPVYRVISVVIDKGDLPHSGVFVLEIIVDTDPTSDKFLRIASPYDLTNLKTDRSVAVAAGATLFLSPYANNDYSALELAMQATQEIDGRVNNLVTTWQTYYGQFYTPTAETIVFPNIDPSYIEELKSNYEFAKAARVAAEADLEEKNYELSDAEDALEAAVSKTELLQITVNNCDKLRNPTTGFWAILYTEITKYVGRTNILFDHMKLAYETWSGSPWEPGSPPDPLDPWYNMYIQMNTWYTTGKQEWDTVGAPQVANVETLLTSICNYASGQYAAAVNAQTNAQSDIYDAQEAKEKATATLAAAQEAEDAALAAVIAVCPDFDPESV